MLKLTPSEHLRWYHFHDNRGNGTMKTGYVDIFLMASSRDNAVKAFYSELGIFPDFITCDCCGPDFSILEHSVEDTFASVTKVYRLLPSVRERMDLSYLETGNLDLERTLWEQETSFMSSDTYRALDNVLILIPLDQQSIDLLPGGINSL